MDKLSETRKEFLISVLESSEELIKENKLRDSELETIFEQLIDVY